MTIARCGSRRGRALDIYLTTNPSLVKSVAVVPCMSDHEGMAVIDTDIRPIYSRPKPRKINIFSKANWDQIQKDTAKFSFDYLKNHTLRSVNTNWTLFKNHVQAMLSKYVPSKQLSTRHNLPWFDKKAKSWLDLSKNYITEQNSPVTQMIGRNTGMSKNPQITT